MSIFLDEQNPKFSKVPSSTRLHLESFDGAQLCWNILFGYNVDVYGFISDKITQKNTNILDVVDYLLETRCVASTIRDLYIAMIEGNFHDYDVAKNFLSYLCEMYLTAINFDRDQDVLGELCPTPLSVIDKYIK